MADTDVGNGRGIFWMLVSVGLFAVMDALVKHLSVNYSVVQIMFFRSAFAFLPLIPMVLRAGGPKSLATKRPLAHLVRSAVGCGSMVLMFLAYKHLPLTAAFTISFAAPLMVTALSVPLLGETVGWRRWLAVIVGFVGVVVAVSPGTSTFQAAAIYPLLGALGYAIVMIAIRRMSDTETSTTIVFYFALFSAVASGILLPWQWTTPDVRGLGLLVLVGLIGGLAQLAMTYSLKLAPVSVLAPFEYTSIIVAVLFDIFVWSLPPAPQVIAGAAIITTAGLYIVHRETRLGTRRKFSSRFARVRVAATERREDPGA